MVDDNRVTFATRWDIEKKTEFLFYFSSLLHFIKLNGRWKCWACNDCHPPTFNRRDMLNVLSFIKVISSLLIMWNVKCRDIKCFDCVLHFAVVARCKVSKLSLGMNYDHKFHAFVLCTTYDPCLHIGEFWILKTSVNIFYRYFWAIRSHPIFSFQQREQNILSRVQMKCLETMCCRNICF